MVQKAIELKNIKKLTRNTDKDLKLPLKIAKTFILFVILGSNIIYALRNFFNTTTFPINGRCAPYNNPSSFPYSLCPGPINTADGVSNPCFAVIKWLAQTLALSWISWRRMLLMNPQKVLKKGEAPSWTKTIPYEHGDIMEILYILGSPLLIPVIVGLGSIFSIVLTYCGSFGAKGGIFFTLLFTFFPPILLAIIAPLISLAQVLNVLYVLLLKPLFTSGGWKYLMRNCIDYLSFPLIIFSIYLLVSYKIIIWPLGVPFAVILAIFFFYKLAGGLRTPTAKVLPPSGIKGTAKAAAVAKAAAATKAAAVAKAAAATKAAAASKVALG